MLPESLCGTSYIRLVDVCWPYLDGEWSRSICVIVLLVLCESAAFVCIFGWSIQQTVCALSRFCVLGIFRPHDVDCIYDFWPPVKMFCGSHCTRRRLQMCHLGCIRWSAIQLTRMVGSFCRWTLSLAITASLLNLIDSILISPMSSAIHCNCSHNEKIVSVEIGCLTSFHVDLPSVKGIESCA